MQGGCDGLESVLSPVPRCNILEFDSPSLMDETQVMLRDRIPALPQGGRIALMACNDDVALGALAAFEEADWLDRVVAVGQNADRLGRAGLRRRDLPFIGSTSYAPEHYGERLIELALKTLRGEPVPPATYCTHVFVTKEIESLSGPSLNRA
jgi:ribose transport system substrate-binding protein